MDAGSPRARMVWRGLALLFAVSVVTIRLGIAGCATPAAKPAATPAAKPAATTAAKPAATAAPNPYLSNPAFFAPTKAAGGFYPGPAPAAAPQQQAGPEPTYPGSDRAGRTQQAEEPR